MSQDEKEANPDHLHEDQDEVGGTDRPPHAEQQKNTGVPGADIEEEDDSEARDPAS